MSYDFDVYARRVATADEMAGLGASSAVLQFEPRAGSTMVMRGARRTYSFTLEGPHRLDAADVPEDIGAVVPGATHLYRVLVEGSVASEIQPAQLFARALARVCDGAVFDPQTDQVWCRTSSRNGRRPGSGERVDVVQVSWHCLRDELVSDPAVVFVDAAVRLLPESLPRRFGEFEPLQGTLADAGVDGFLEVWRGSTLNVSFRGSGPVVGGSLEAGPGHAFPSAYWSMSLDLLADPLREPDWSDALRSLFVRLADALPAFYGSAELTRGFLWERGSLWADRSTERPISPVFRGVWQGLPPRPTWWTWLGQPFTEYVPLLPADRTSRNDRGVLYQAADRPIGPGGCTPLSAWLPEELFSRGGHVTTGWQRAPVVPARTIPGALRRT